MYMDRMIDLFKYFKFHKDGLHNPKGPLSKVIPSAVISQIKKEVANSCDRCPIILSVRNVDRATSNVLAAVIKLYFNVDMI